MPVQWRRTTRPRRPARLADGLGLERAPVRCAHLRPRRRLSSPSVGPPLPRGAAGFGCMLGVSHMPAVYSTEITSHWFQSLLPTESENHIPESQRPIPVKDLRRFRPSLKSEKTIPAKVPTPLVDSPGVKRRYRAGGHSAWLNHELRLSADFPMVAHWLAATGRCVVGCRTIPAEHRPFTEIRTYHAAMAVDTEPHVLKVTVHAPHAGEDQ